MEIKLPSNWSDVSVYQYQELKSINPAEYDTDIDIIIEQIMILSGVDDYDIFTDMDFDDLLSMMLSIKWINNEPPKNFNNNFKEYTLKNINKISLGEFIDLDHYFSDDYIKNLHLICSILYKRYKTDEWGNEIEEPYIYDINTRSELFLDIPIGTVYGIIDYYINFKGVISEKYIIIFQDELGELEETEGLSEEEIEDINKEIEADRKKVVWSWPVLINNLSNNDITKYDEITNIPAVMVFNDLLMRKVMDIRG